MITLINICSAWLIYEIGVGLLVIKGEHFSYEKKRPYVPPTLLHAKSREKYLEWKEWKGNRFD